jgi:hypothetical protein
MNTRQTSQLSSYDIEEGRSGTNSFQRYMLQEKNAPHVARPTKLAAVGGLVGGLLGSATAALTTVVVQGTRLLMFNKRQGERKETALADLDRISEAIRTHYRENVIDAFRTAFLNLGRVRLPARAHAQHMRSVMTQDGETLNLFIRMFMYCRDIQLVARDIGRLFAPVVYDSNPQHFSQERILLTQMYTEWLDDHPRIVVQK